MSILAFIIANIVIDIEVIINVLLGYRPLHAILHTYWAATVIGLLSGVAVNGVGRLVEQNRETWTLRPALLGGVLGGLSQPILDSVMHVDVRPFWPVSEANPMLHSVDPQTLHAACTVAGLAGGSVLIIRWWLVSEIRQSL